MCPVHGGNAVATVPSDAAGHPVVPEGRFVALTAHPA